MGIRGSAGWTVGPLPSPGHGAGWAWGCDEFTVGPGKCDTHGEVLYEEGGSGGCLPGGPGAGRLGAWALSISCKARGLGGERAQGRRCPETRGWKRGWLWGWQGSRGRRRARLADPLPSFHGSVTGRMKRAISQNRETSPFILYVGEKCHEGALKSNVKWEGE